MYNVNRGEDKQRIYTISFSGFQECSFTPRGHTVISCICAHQTLTAQSLKRWATGWGQNRKQLDTGGVIEAEQTVDISFFRILHGKFVTSRKWFGKKCSCTKISYGLNA